MGMPQKREVRVRLALFGPPGSGKTAALEHLHRSSPPDQRGPLIQFADRRGKSFLFDHAEFQLGEVGDLPLLVDVYAVPGAPWAVLAQRMILCGCDAVVFCCDARDSHLEATREAWETLREELVERGRTIPQAAVVALMTHADLLRPGQGKFTLGLLGDELSEERRVSGTTSSGEHVAEAVRKATALALALEREELQARQRGEPPPRVVVPADLEAEIELAHQLYLRASGQAGAQFSPHGDVFLGWVLQELGAVAAPDLEEALRLRGEAARLSLPVTLEDLLVQRGLVDPAALPRALRLRASAEVIHEEILFGKLAVDMGLVPLARVKQALALQAKRSFHHSLDALLCRAGHLDRLSRRQLLIRLLQTHQGELMREDRDPALVRAAPAAGSAAPEEEHKKPALPLFGEVALNLGLVSREQVDECLSEQRRLKQAGKHRFIGALMQQKGYLGDEEIRRVCRALEEKISDDRIQGYRIVSDLGRGNMALVFAAIQLNLDRIVALKILDPKLLLDADFIERFVSEARAAARLNHPNIVQAYDVGSCQDLHYFAMEFVDGITAKKLLEDSGQLDEDTAVDIVLQVARALDHAAEHKLVHRDVKPGNVMITRDGVIKLCDLGLAKTLDAETSRDDAVILGSPYYISPEQIEGRPDLDIRADIYSLGAMLYHLLTGRPPFAGRTPEEVCLRHLSDPVPDPTFHVPGLSRRLPGLISRMMAKERRERPASSADVVKALQEIKPRAGTDERRSALARRVADRVPTRRFLQRRR